MTEPEIAALVRRYVDEQSSLVFLRLDARGAIVDANRFTRQRLGHDWREKSWRTLFLFSDAIPDPAQLATDPDRSYLLHMATTAGLPETVRVQFFASGDKTLVFGSPDPDETMRLRGEMITLNNQLNALTRELQKKNYQLEELNRLKNQFLGMAAHDLRKPVSAILSYTEFLLDEAGGRLNAEHLGFLKTIHGSTGLMRRVIDDFLDVSMIESGRFEIHSAPADMRVPVEAAIALNRVIAQKKGWPSPLILKEIFRPWPLIQQKSNRFSTT